MQVERGKYIIWAADVDRALKFYTKVRGAEITKQNHAISELTLCGAIIAPNLCSLIQAHGELDVR